MALSVGWDLKRRHNNPEPRRTVIHRSTLLLLLVFDRFALSPSPLLMWMLDSKSVKHPSEINEKLPQYLLTTTVYLHRAERIISREKNRNILF